MSDSLYRAWMVQDAVRRSQFQVPMTRPRILKSHVRGKLSCVVREAVLLIHCVTHVPPQCASLILFTPYVGGTYLSGKLCGKGVTCIIS
jgi:hypothetical protein